MIRLHSLGALSLVLFGCASAPPPGGPSPVAAAALAPPLAHGPDAAPPPIDARPTAPTPEDRTRDDARAPLANAILDAYTNFGAQLSRDGKKVLFGSRRSGNREYYVADASSRTPPVQVTRGPERAESAVFSRDAAHAIFLRDTGADENYRIYRVGLDGNDETCLTPGPVLHRYRPFEPQGKPGTLVYAQRDARSPATEVVVQAMTGEPKVVYRQPGPGYLLGVTRDGTRALVNKRTSSSEFVLVELDLASGQTHRLYPAEDKKVTVHDAGYSPDGKTVYVSADDGADGEWVFAIGAASGKIARQYRMIDPATAAIDSLHVSPRGDVLALQIDAGDHDEVRLFDARSLKETSRVAAPAGDDVFATRFSEDGTKLTATVTSPNHPSDIVAIDVRTATLSPLLADARPGLGELPSIDTSIEAAKAFDGLPLPVIAYLPGGARAAGKRLPVIVDFHGGPAGSSSIGWDVFVRFFTALGYAFVQPNTRGSTGYGRAFEMADNREKRADWLEDVATINAWVKAQPWADPSRVVAMGGSYGGYTVLMALTRQPTLWRAGVDYVGIANLHTFLKSTDQLIRAAWVNEFGDVEKDRDLLERFSPLRDVANIVAPLYVYAGQNDPRVPREESDQVVAALRARGVPVEYQVAPDEGHSLDRRANRLEFMTRVARFLDDHASSPPPSP